MCLFSAFKRLFNKMRLAYSILNIFVDIFAIPVEENARFYFPRDSV